jgi:hypothetical protein
MFSFQYIQGIFIGFFCNSLKLPMKFDHTEFQVYQASSIYESKKLSAGFTVLSKNETFIPGSLLEVTV